MAKAEVGGPGTEQEPGVEIELLSGAQALEAVDRAAIDMQIATAKKYPRQVTTALAQANTLATMDEETAASMTYGLPRGNKIIEGPSARLAEVMLYSWGNIRADADIVAQDDKTVTAMGTCHDLEKNVAVRVRVSRSIVDKYSNRYNDDMVNVTKNAAISIALRNAVFKVIPRALADRVWAAARTASLGQGGTITQKRQKLLEWYGKLGVQPEEIFQLLEVAGIDDVGEEELIKLRALANSIKEGETSVENAFRSESAASRQAAEKTAEKASSLKERIQAAQQKQTAAEHGKAIEEEELADGPDFPDDEEGETEDATVEDDGGALPV